MFKSKHNIVSICFIICILCIIIGASLPQNPYGNFQFEGFNQGSDMNPLLLKVDTDAVINGDYHSVGDPCPCTEEYPTAEQPSWSGTCASHGGTLILDPYDLDGVTCNNPDCPCNYYVTATYIEGRFEGFPFLEIPLDNELIILLTLSLLYVIYLLIRKKKTIS